MGQGYDDEDWGGLARDLRRKKEKDMATKKKLTAAAALKQIDANIDEINKLVQNSVELANEAGVEFHLNPSGHYGTGVSYIPEGAAEKSKAYLAWEKMSEDDRIALGLPTDEEEAREHYDESGYGGRTGWVSSSDMC